MSEFILTYDLGTSSTKATLYDGEGGRLASKVSDYPTYYYEGNRHEQKPIDWWNAILNSTRELLAASRIDPTAVSAITLSGQSLTVVPIDKNGKVLLEKVPIWSDTSSHIQADRYFASVEEDRWYMKTGNGFPRSCYSVFKIMKLHDDHPEIYEQMYKVLGSKDYINYLLTGVIATDYSYASGLGAYDLLHNRYDDELLEPTGIPKHLLPDVIASTQCIGTLLPDKAKALGLHPGVKVFCGGVDNSCMALGAGVFEPGSQYLSLGSSAWIAVSTPRPLFDITIRPFIFTHVVPGAYTSATSIFSAGSTFRWLRDTVFPDIATEAQRLGKGSYETLVSLAEESPVGSNGLLFNPSLGGVPASYYAPYVKGGVFGLSLGHTRNDIVRSVLEGICFDLLFVHRRLAAVADLSDELIIVGGGSRSLFWRQMFADIFNMRCIKTSVGQEAASLGAAAIGSVGMGWWDGFNHLHDLISHENVECPRPEYVDSYTKLRSVIENTWNIQSEMGLLLETYRTCITG